MGFPPDKWVPSEFLTLRLVHPEATTVSGFPAPAQVSVAPVNHDSLCLPVTPILGSAVCLVFLTDPRRVIDFSDYSAFFHFHLKMDW